MQCTTKKLPKNVVEINCEIALEELKADLENAARDISKERPLDGYRPGKAPYDAVKARFGEMAIYEAALAAVVRKNYVKAVRDNDLRTFGQPEINVTRIAPGNPLAFTATVPLVPAVLTLADFRSIKIKSKTPKTEEKKIDDALKELQRMQTKEVRANREARENDKIVVDMDLSIAGVPLDGGQARDHGIYLDEDYYIPGLRAQVIGMKDGEKKNFALKFPDTHYQKNIAGKNVDFAVTLKEVYELQNPPLTDEFAKALGQESMEKLRALLRENMEKEAEEKERQRAEIEALEKLVEKSKFEEVPDAILNAEVERMIEELRHSVSHRGIAFEDYLKNIKKTVDELKSEFTSQAVKRIKTTLVIKEIGEREKVEVTDAELLEEVNSQINEQKDAEAQARIRSDEYQDYLRAALRNRKTLELIRKTSVQQE